MVWDNNFLMYSNSAVGKIQLKALFLMSQFIDWNSETF